MTEQPLVSIIIPTYNRADLIGETLDSIIGQTYQNWECIVVDDGSTDHTEEILSTYIKKDNRISYHKRPSIYKSGGNGARNYGFDISKGEYINWFDSDDVMLESKIEKQVIDLYNSKYNFTVCHISVFEDNINNILGLRSEFIHSKNNFYDFLIHQITWLTNSVLWKKSFLLKTNYRFNEKLRAAQEWEFISIVLSKENNYSYISESLILNRKHDNSISYNEDKNKERAINYLNARKFVYKYIEKREELLVEKKYLLDYIITQTENLIREKDYKSLNKVIFYSGINLESLISFVSIYFFIYTDKLKSKIKYV
ncbi:glycosyltransferase family 2 protein [Empedobacter tilapiae]|uniref:glycosyltransferase family 2 protein n=1 Tax=Empedobacter tilapiae TaxID=2491114 RepID=UPI0028D23AE6|nr:glycosyltransferase family 2 protein [Empedobacter tilapiae]